ncbi:hypothetical protein HYE21_02380 [Mycoplasmopsis bovis]|nr:hypothetical protein [Mycoplasmopsis bovis]QQH24380.1 hypothetical protein HYE21_02380 [Mycoplasmopsis bovis]
MKLDDGESISEIFRMNEAQKILFKKARLTAEYENHWKNWNQSKSLKSDSDKKSEVLEYFKKLKTLIKAQCLIMTKTFKDIDKIFRLFRKSSHMLVKQNNNNQKHCFIDT